MNLKWTRILFLILHVAGLLMVILTFFGPWTDRAPLFILLALLMTLIKAMVDYKKWRCNHCGNHLGKKILKIPDRCPHCGHLLDPKEKIETERWKNEFYGEDDAHRHL